MIFNGRPVARATALMVVSSSCFGSLTTLTLLVTRSGLPLVPAMLWRYMLAAVALFFLARPLMRKASMKQALRLMLIGGCGQAVITYLSLRALDYLPVGPLAFLFYTYPAWVALIAAISRRDELTGPRLLALAIAMAGILVMIGAPSAESLNTVGVMLALGTALIYAMYLPVLHKIQAGIPPLLSTFYLVSGAFLSFLITSVATGQVRVPQTLSLWAFVVVLSLVGTVIAFVSMIAGLGVLGPVRTSIISTIEPFFTALLGVVILREQLTFAMIAGGAMIAGAVLVLQLNVPAEAEPTPTG